MSTLTDHIEALRRNRERYVQSLANLDEKLEREKAKPPVANAEDEAQRIPLVEQYVASERAKLLAAIAAIDADFAILK